MEISDIMNLTYEMCRKHEDRLRMSWEDDRANIISKNRKLQKKNHELYNQMIYLNNKCDTLFNNISNNNNDNNNNNNKSSVEINPNISKNYSDVLLNNKIENNINISNPILKKCNNKTSNEIIIKRNDKLYDNNNVIKKDILKMVNVSNFSSSNCYFKDDVNYVDIPVRIGLSYNKTEDFIFNSNNIISNANNNISKNENEYKRKNSLEFTMKNSSKQSKINNNNNNNNNTTPMICNELNPIINKIKINFTSDVKNPIKFTEVMRNKAARECLPGTTCNECNSFYKALLDQGIMTPNGYEEKLKMCSRHKAQWTPPTTPEGFWDLSVNTPKEWNIENEILAKEKKNNT
jgi:hypothetical protein